MMNASIMQLCYFCGEEEFVDVHEIWGSDFELDTCCSASHEGWVDAMNCPVDGREAREYIATLSDQYIDTRQVFISSDEGIRIDFGLRLEPISRSEAKGFVREHHRHNPPPAGDKFRLGCYNGDQLIAVAIVGRPVARLIDHTQVLEVNRLCVDHSLDRELTWKACSALYNAAALEGASRGYHEIITYTLADQESGMSLRYARWKKGHRTRGGTWSRPSRQRSDRHNTGPKIRWSKALR